MKFKLDYIGLAILLSVFVSSYIIHQKLEEVRLTVKEAQTPKLEIVDINQFSKLCNQLTEQWHAKGYVFYILQPKSPVKTHKEKASSSMDFDQLPIRVELTDSIYKKQLINQKYVVGDTLDAKKLLNTDTFCGNQFILIPVYQHNTIVGELYVSYDNKIDTTSILNKVSEAQVLAQLLN